LTHKAVKILADNGSGSFTWVQTAIASERADDVARLAKGEFVVWNGSFGGGTSLVSGVETELEKSTKAGVVFVFAAGNTGAVGVQYPGNGKYSIATASADQNLARSSFSTTGPEVWSIMPGRNINSTYKGNTWASLSGTSMASPFNTAAVAIGFSKWGNKMGDLARIRAYLAWCAKDLGAPGKDNEFGWGIELIQNILDRDPANTPGLPTDPPPPPPPPTPGLKSITPLNVTLKMPVKVYWDNVSAALPTSEGRTFKTAGRGSRPANKALALKTSVVWFDISAPSTTNATATAEKLEKEVAAYFTSRGFMLPQGQDESWAAYWAAYFLEMGLQQGASKWGITVTRVTLDTVGGQKVPITELKHWPIK